MQKACSIALGGGLMSIHSVPSYSSHHTKVWMSCVAQRAWSLYLHAALQGVQWPATVSHLHALISHLLVAAQQEDSEAGGEMLWVIKCPGERTLKCRSTLSWTYFRSVTTNKSTHFRPVICSRMRKWFAARTLHISLYYYFYIALKSLWYIHTQIYILIISELFLSSSANHPLH